MDEQSFREKENSSPRVSHTTKLIQTPKIDDDNGRVSRGHYTTADTTTTKILILFFFFAIKIQISLDKR